MDNLSTPDDPSEEEGEEEANREDPMTHIKGEECVRERQKSGAMFHSLSFCW